jgi:hypothetical protein
MMMVELFPNCVDTQRKLLSSSVAEASKGTSEDDGMAWRRHRKTELANQKKERRRRSEGGESRSNFGFG